MTIAACYVSPEGVVLGADSTASVNSTTDGFHYFNHTQKIFEIGESGTLGALTWGMGTLGELSYRTLFADFAGELETSPAKDIEEVGSRWSAKFWEAYSHSKLTSTAIVRCRELNEKSPYDAQAEPTGDTTRTKDEEEEFLRLRNSLFVGFCIGGYLLSDRRPAAVSVEFDPLIDAPPTAKVLAANTRWFWGAPNIFHRLITGIDLNLFERIDNSEHWTGTTQDLVQLVQQFQFGHPILPIREAIDFVHVCIYSTIKALKFSNFSQICGGPIEVAVITTDRRFRWVRHKDFDTAIDDGVPI